MSHCLSACLPGSNKDLGAASHDPYRPVSACAFCQPTTPTCSGASLSHVSLALGCLFLFLLFYSQPHLRMPSPCLPQASVYQGNLRTPLQITLRCFNSSAHCILLSTQGTGGTGLVETLSPSSLPHPNNIVMNATEASALQCTQKNVSPNTTFATQ